MYHKVAMLPFWALAHITCVTGVAIGTAIAGRKYSYVTVWDSWARIMSHHYFTLSGVVESPPIYPFARGDTYKTTSGGENSIASPVNKRLHMFGTQTWDI